jgi:hypothetical protein
VFGPSDLDCRSTDMHGRSVVIYLAGMGQGREGRIPEDKRQVTFLSNDDINPISPTKDAPLDIKRRQMQTHMPGSKDHEGHFCPALEVTNNGHSTRRGRVTTLNIPKSYSSPAHERPCCIPSTDCGTVRDYRQRIHEEHAG